MFIILKKSGLYNNLIPDLDFDWMTSLIISNERRNRPNVGKRAKSESCRKPEDDLRKLNALKICKGNPKSHCIWNRLDYNPNPLLRKRKVDLYVLNNLKKRSRVPRSKNYSKYFVKKDLHFLIVSFFLFSRKNSK